MTRKVYDAGMRESKPWGLASSRSGVFGGPEPGCGGEAAAPAGVEEPSGQEPPLSNRGVKHGDSDGHVVGPSALSEDRICQILGDKLGLLFSENPKPNEPNYRKMSIDFGRWTLRGSDIYLALRTTEQWTCAEWSGGQGFRKGQMLKRPDRLEDVGWYRHFGARSEDSDGRSDYESWEWMGPVDLEPLTLALSWQGPQCTRLDLTVDFAFGGAERAAYMRPYAFRRYVRKGLKCQEYQKGEVDNPGKDGQTFYVGGRSSLRRLRIYDKHLEMGKPNGNPLLRIEVELHGLMADCAWADIHAGKSVPSLWRAHVEGMLETLPAWVLEGIERCELSTESQERSSVDQAIRTMCKQWGAYLEPIVLLGTPALDHLRGILSVMPSGRAKLKRAEQVYAYLQKASNMEAV
ncbi:MAG: replication initiation factor domain-containing protein [Phycisphaerae bacterium]